MKTTHLFKEYIWLINLIYRSGGITLDDINKEWVKTSMSNGLTFDRNTFRRHRNELEDMFGLIIEIGKGYKYYIKNDYVLRQDTVQNWLLSTLSVNNIISESMSVQDRIFLESIPEVSHLEMLLEAMKRGRKVCITYRKYGSEDDTLRILEPYFLKLHRRRWYVMGNTPDGYRLFSFDRIGSAAMTDERFTMPKDFNAREYFDDCFGVMRDERHPTQRIVLRAFGNERHYLDDLPIHSTQRQIGEGEGYADFEVYMRPTSDFIAHIMSRGAWLKVLEPQSLIEDVKATLRKAAELYS